MVERNTTLWHRLQQFQLDDPEHRLTFTARLARENAWSLSFAQRVTEEYKRFLYLAVAAGHPVTPSDQVDQAWHLHLTYTRSYWDSLCAEVLRRPLHHNPTEGGATEDRKFHDWYDKTKRSYAEHFGAHPPEDIWPDAKTRFEHDVAQLRVNARDCWIVRKPSRRVLAWGGLAALGLTMVGAASRGEVHDSSAAYVVLIVIGVIFFAVLLATLGTFRTRRNGQSGWFGCGAGGCSTHDSGGCGSGCGAGCGGGCGS
ncbi:MAG: hypothetical protein AB7N71_02425 [Phycisphaerae bacterium]